MALGSNLKQRQMTLFDRVGEVSWPLVVIVIAIACVGFAMLYSAADGSFGLWSQRQLIRFGVCLVIMLTTAIIDLRFWMRHAYTLYGITLALLIAVEIMGSIGMGAQRWVDLKVIQLQPSELMKITLVLALARYFHSLSHEEVGRVTLLVPPLALIALPTLLVLRQPDLGTSMMLVLAATALMFVAGVRWWKFALVGAAAAGATPVVWNMLHDYQRRRVLTFVDPSTDPLGAGYHIMQSKIALGSGGLFGKGFLSGTQSHLNFLPERQTDFIFTMLAEEFGLAGAGFLLLLYLLIFAYGIAIALRARSQFGRLLGVGLTTTLFLYVFINVAMVTGVIPVVGVPLPLISYGGTAMLTVMIGLGLLLSVWVHRDVAIGRNAVGTEDEQE